MPVCSDYLANDHVVVSVKIARENIKTTSIFIMPVTAGEGKEQGSIV